MVVMVDVIVVMVVVLLVIERRYGKSLFHATPEDEEAERARLLEAARGATRIDALVMEDTTGAQTAGDGDDEPYDRPYCQCSHWGEWCMH